jgi:CRISPR system Cascade subunit CasE
VFLAEVEKSGKDAVIKREEIYRRWLTQQLEKGGAACVNARLTAFRQIWIVRRDNHRRACALRRPDAMVEGVLHVLDSDRFQRLLRHGIGRHRAFGFGMLLLRR